MISVIIPLYNKEPIIERTLKSVLSQDYDDYEVIVVNDGSTDKGAEFVKSLDDPRIILIEQENGGPSKARNTGIKYAKGEWATFLDADDEFLPNAIETFSNSILSHPDANFIVFPFYNYDGKDKRLMYICNEVHICNPFKLHFLDLLLPRTGAFVCKKELIIENLFDERLRRFEDVSMLFNIYRTANIYLSSVPTMIVNAEYASASRGRQDISEDFVGHLDFDGKSFWEKMCLYKLYLGERPHYPGQIDKLYPRLKYRYDLLLLSKLIDFIYR